MPQTFSVVSTLLPLLLATGALAREDGAEDGTRRIDVAGKAGGTAAELPVAPGLVTTLVFDTPLDLEAMKTVLEGLASRFGLADVGVSGLTLTLRPSASFTQGTRQRLAVRFAQGEEPRSAVLELVSVSKETAERQVEVRRKPPAPEERVAVLEARGAACEAELTEVKARGAMPLALLVLAGELKPEQRRGSSLFNPQKNKQPQESVKFAEPALYRTRKRAVLSLRLSLPLGARPWTPGELEVRDARTGRDVKVHGVAMEPPVLEPGAEALLAAEWEASPDADGAVDVRVLERDGVRPVGIKGVEPGTP